MDTASLKKRLDAIPNIPTLPAVALKVNDMLMNSNTSMRELSDLVMKDQAIVSNLLRIVNSSFYGFGSQIDSVHRAITVMGIETVRNAIMAVSIIPAFSKTTAGNDFSLSAFWRHSIAVAITSRQLARRLPGEVPETCFTAGLLHDVGKVIIARHFKEESSAIKDLEKQGMRGHEAERTILSMDHAEVGGYLAQKWHLPDNLIQAIIFHHASQSSAMNRNLAAVVHAADGIVHRAQLNWDSTSTIEIAHAYAVDLRGLIETAPSWFTEIEPEITAACAFFGIE